MILKFALLRLARVTLGETKRHHCRFGGLQLFLDESASGLETTEATGRQGVYFYSPALALSIKEYRIPAKALPVTRYVFILLQPIVSEAVDAELHTGVRACVILH
jgi:hypothetical protein